MNPSILLPLLLLALLAAFTPRLRARILLSKAKHRSLAGHARIGKEIARRIPGYAYDETRFFASDDAPHDIAEQRRAGFARLAERFRARYRESIRVLERLAPGVSDLQFVGRYRVPFPYSRMVREHLKSGVLVTESSGVELTDLDGNRTFDLTGSYGVNVLGYDFYKDCIAAGSERVGKLGPVLGSYHPVIEDNVRRLQELSGLDEVSFHMSGTEAVMQAVRLARYHTGRSHLVRFCGAYHGWWEEVQPGIGNPGRVGDVYTLKDMDPTTLRVLRSRRDIACVLVNPLQALHPNAGAPSDASLIAGDRRARLDRAAYGDWLRELRKVCDERGIVLILDEIFVGFRISWRGAQEYFGVPADLVTYGKTLGGGLPVGVVCGKGHLMKRFREDRPADICFARGTFNSHPYVMAAMNEFLRRAEQPDTRALYRDLDATWDGRAQRFNERLAEAGLPVRVANLSSIFTSIYNVPSRYNWMYQFYLAAEDLTLPWVGTGRFIFSLNYAPEDFDAVVERFVRAGRAMQADGWWWHPADATNRSVKRHLLKEMLRSRLGRPVAAETRL